MNPLSISPILLAGVWSILAGFSAYAQVLDHDAAADDFVRKLSGRSYRLLGANSVKTFSFSEKGVTSLGTSGKPVGNPAEVVGVRPGLIVWDLDTTRSVYLLFPQEQDFCIGTITQGSVQFDLVSGKAPQPFANQPDFVNQLNGLTWKPEGDSDVTLRWTDGNLTMVSASTQKKETYTCKSFGSGYLLWLGSDNTGLMYAFHPSGTKGWLAVVDRLWIAYPGDAKVPLPKLALKEDLFTGPELELLSGVERLARANSPLFGSLIFKEVNRRITQRKGPKAAADEALRFVSDIR